MNDKKYGTAPSHTQAWIFQTWLSFIVSISATSLGVIYLDEAKLERILSQYDPYKE